VPIDIEVLVGIIPVVHACIVRQRLRTQGFEGVQICTGRLTADGLDPIPEVALGPGPPAGDRALSIGRVVEGQKRLHHLRQGRHEEDGELDIVRLGQAHPGLEGLHCLRERLGAPVRLIPNVAIAELLALLRAIVTLQDHGHTPGHGGWEDTAVDEPSDQGIVVVASPERNGRRPGVGAPRREVLRVVEIVAVEELPYDEARLVGEPVATKNDQLLLGPVRAAPEVDDTQSRRRSDSPDERLVLGDPGRLGERVADEYYVAPGDAGWVAEAIRICAVRRRAAALRRRPVPRDVRLPAEAQLGVRGRVRPLDPAAVEPVVGRMEPRLRDGIGKVQQEQREHDGRGHRRRPQRHASPAVRGNDHDDGHAQDHQNKGNAGVDVQEPVVAPQIRPARPPQGQYDDVEERECQGD